MELDAVAPVPLSPEHDRSGPAAADAAVGVPATDRVSVVGALYASHALGLIRLAHIMLGNRQAAEDVVQEAFTGLYRRWSHLEDQAKALTYVRSSVLNGCRSQLRRRATWPLDGSDGLPVASAESVVLTAEERHEVIGALRCLPARQREVLVLRFYLDLPDDQIAAAMRISRGTVRSTAHRGLAALDRALRERPWT
jgi:RNA polymerase sigma-70 factor (sigma-E family)